MSKPLKSRGRLADARAAVYRFFNSSDELLYLGLTHNIEERWGTHARIQPWWLDVVRREFTWYETRKEAEQVEAAATALEKPRYDRSGQRTEGGEVEQRLDIETTRAMEAVSADIASGTYALWSLLPAYGELSERYGVPVIGITRGLTQLARRDRTLVSHRDQFAVSLPDRTPSEDAQRIGLLFFLASNAFGDSSFTLSDLTETTGTSRFTAQQRVKQWERSGHVERIRQDPRTRVFVYRIAQHPEPDPPPVLTFWSTGDLLALIDWLNQQLETDLSGASGEEAERALIERDQAVIDACSPDEYGVSRAGVRVLKVVARQYVHRPGCLPEWGIAPF